MFKLNILKEFNTANSPTASVDKFKSQFLASIRQPQKRELARLILNHEPIPEKYGAIRVAEMREQIRWAKKGMKKYCETCSVADLM